MPTMSHSPVRVVLFDVGGVLVQLNGVATLLSWVAHRYTPAELWRTWLQSPAVRAFETGRSDADTFAACMVRELELELQPALFLESFAAWPTGLYPGALELIGRIPARYTRALLSNSNALHWPRVVNEVGLGTAAFDCHFVSHLIGKIKPDSDAFQHVVDALRCEPAAVLFLDDNLLNIEAARSFGMQAELTCGVEQAERVLCSHGILAAPGPGS